MTEFLKSKFDKNINEVKKHRYKDEHEEIAKLLNKIYKERNYLNDLIKQLENV